MTVQDAIRITRTMKPNQYSDRDMARWLSDLDGQIYRDILRTHEHAPGNPPYVYELPGDADWPLLVDEPYTDLYIKYLCAQVDYHNAEFDRYNNAMMMFNTVYQAYANWINRTRMPRQDHAVGGVR